MALLQTGGAKAVSDNAALIGALVALGGVFTAQMVSIALDDRRTQEARDLEAQRTGEAALQNYFEAVGKLLIEKPLYKANPDDRLSAVVRAQTLALLEGLDPDRKRILLQFLNESKLILKSKPVVSLSTANLRDANLSVAYLPEADLSETDLREAFLIATDLHGADLHKTWLSKANLSAADLSETDLREALLPEADLIATDLHGADLSGADLMWADLHDANLRGANLQGATLSGADLRGVYLNDADLHDADLRQANLQGAIGGYTYDLLAQARNLKGATMPNGQKYEEWLKSRGEENSGPS